MLVALIEQVFTMMTCFNFNYCVAGTPNILNRLAAEGAYSLNGARNIIPTVSGPNWGGHLTSMNVHNTGMILWLGNGGLSQTRIDIGKS